MPHRSHRKTYYMLYWRIVNDSIEFFCFRWIDRKLTFPRDVFQVVSPSSNHLTVRKLPVLKLQQVAHRIFFHLKQNISAFLFCFLMDIYSTFYLIDFSLFISGAETLISRNFEFVSNYLLVELTYSADRWREISTTRWIEFIQVFVFCSW